MQTSISGHHIDITDALRQYVEEKISKVERHFDNLISANVVLTVEKHEHKAEATMLIGGGPQIFANASGDDLYAAIDLMIDKLDRQVRRHKTKVTDHHR